MRDIAPNSTFRIAEHFSVVSRRDDVADEIGTGCNRALRLDWIKLNRCTQPVRGDLSSKGNCRANGTLVNPHFSPPRLLSSNLKRPTAWPWRRPLRRQPDQTTTGGG